MSETVKNKGWTVTFAGLGINLALGILYAWSIFKSAIEASIKSGGAGAFNWDLAKLNDPYSVCCLVFAFSMILAGRCYDKFGPRITAFIGGLLVGLGLIWISQTTSYLSWVLGFGVLGGAGMGFGYSASTPPGLKWFPASKTGLIAGLIVAGFGLAPVYIAPLSGYLIKSFGVNQAMFVYGVSFVGVVCGLAMLLVNPPAGYVPKETNLATRIGEILMARGSLKTEQLPSVVGQLGSSKEKFGEICIREGYVSEHDLIQALGEQFIARNKKAVHNDVNWKDAIKTLTFWKLWAIYFVGSGAGLMVISSVAGIAKHSMGELAFIAVGIMAIGNAGGRIITGVLSDRFGRNHTILAVHLFQGLLMLAAIPLIGNQNTSAIMIVLLATFMGFNYGANLALFPSIAKDLWGIKAYGVNYGILFTAWGVGGFVLSKVSQMLKTSTGSMTSSFVLAAILLSISGMLTLTLGKKEEEEVDEIFLQPGLGLTMADGGEKVSEDTNKES
jgi:MFS family permease